MSTQRIAIFSDIHANVDALRAAKNQWDELGVDTYWCLGDVVGYGPRVNEVIRELRAWMGDVDSDGYSGAHKQHLWVAGNHDYGLMEKYPAGSIQMQMSSGTVTLNISPDASTTWERQRIWLQTAHPDLYEYMKKLIDTPPVRQVPVLANGYVAHARLYWPKGENNPSQDDMMEAIWDPDYSVSKDTVLERMYHSYYDILQPETDETFVLMCSGHTHIPVMKRRPLLVDADAQQDPGCWEDLTDALSQSQPISLDDGYIYYLNDGSIGFPKTGRGCPTYGLLTVTDDRNPSITLKTVAYDTEAVREDLEYMEYPRTTWSLRQGEQKPRLSPCRSDNET